MKKLKFAPDLVSLILKGEKYSTWRLFDDKNLSIGDELEFINRKNNEVFGYAIIIDIKEKKFGDITDEDLAGHEKFESREVMLLAYRGYYGDKVDEESIVKIIRFSFKLKKS